jgi:AraC-like DNA-binding protein
MSVQPLHVHASLVFPFVEFMTHTGSLMERDLEEAGLPVLDYSEADSAVSESALCNFVNHCASFGYGMEFGLESAAATGMESEGINGLIESEMSVWSVLNRICEQKNRLSPYPRYWLERDREITWICRGAHIAPFDIRDIELFAVYRLIEVVRVLTGGDFVSPEIRLKTHNPGEIRRYPLLESARLKFDSPHTCIAVPHRLLMAPARMIVDDDFLAAVRAHLDAVLVHNRLPGINDVSESMGISRRSLQRFLKGRNTSFRALHDEYVFKTARNIWLNGDESINEVAIELGYSNHANFNRAIARIVGTTPSAFRDDVKSWSKVTGALCNESHQESRVELTAQESGKDYRQSKVPRNFNPKDLKTPRSARAGFSFKNTWQLNFSS